MGTNPSTDEDEELSLGVLFDPSPLLSLSLESRSPVEGLRRKESQFDARKTNETTKATNLASAA